MCELRLVDPDGYTVPEGVRTTTDETNALDREYLQKLAAEHAAQWAGFGYDARDYRIV